MCRVNNCCCCLDLRTGCIGISILLIILTLLSTTITAVSHEFNGTGAIVAFVIVTILAVACWIILLVGSIMRNVMLILVSWIGLLIYIAIQGILVVWIIYILAIWAGYVGASTQITGLVTGSLVAFLVFLLAFMGLNIYFVVVIANFMRSLRAGESGAANP